MMSLALGLIGLVPQGGMETRIDAIAKGVVGKRTPGITIVVQRGRTTLYRKGFGTDDLAGKIPASTATPYQIGSLTKAFTAAVVQKLAAERKLGIDDPVRRYFPAAPESWSGLTVRHLLNHVSGLPDYTEGMRLALRAGPMKSPEEVVAWAMRQKLKARPGTEFDYSNTNYFLLGLIAERTGGAPLEKQFRARVFNPLQMKTSRFPGKGNSVPGEPAGTRVAGGKLVPAIRCDLSWPFAAGAIVASADDLANWLGGIADGRVLSEDQKTQAFTPYKLVDGELSFYGFGWILGTRGMAPMLSHGGGIDGFSSAIAYLPASDVRLVILANSEDAETSSLVGPILDAVEGKSTVPAILDKDPNLTERLQTVVARMLKGERDAGEFDPAFLQKVPEDVYAKTGRELAKLGPVVEFVLVRDERAGEIRRRDYRLTLGEATLTIQFTIGPDGKIAGFRLI